MKILTTEHLILKPHTMDNLNKMNEWENDPELIYFNDDDPFTYVPPDLTQRHLDRVINSNDSRIIRLAIHKACDDALIGFCSLAELDYYNLDCKLGITIGDKTEWGKGYGKEVVGELLRYCFEELHLNRVEAEVFSFNPRSQKLFSSMGFTLEGRRRESVFKKGEFADDLIFGILRREWESL